MSYFPSTLRPTMSGRSFDGTLPSVAVDRFEEDHQSPIAALTAWIADPHDQGFQRSSPVGSTDRKGLRAAYMFGWLTLSAWTTIRSRDLRQ